VLEAIAGHDPRDAASATVAGWQASEKRRTDLRGLRVGLLVELTEDMDAECPELFDAALGVLRELGADIEPVNVPDLQYVNAIAFGVMEPEAASYHAHWLRERPQDYAPQTRRGLEAASVLFATQYVDAQRLRARFNQGFMRLFERFDVLCLPSQPELPTLITADDDSGSHDEWDLRHTVIANLTGVPAVSIPCGFTQAQLPFSLQLLAPPFADKLALDVADAYQSATEWHLRRPPDFM
jgi:aspartyl-tRNA(Asn)/glutamyl-tRNA(Gln) amidotransferase subunit A